MFTKFEPESDETLIRIMPFEPYFANFHPFNKRMVACQKMQGFSEDYMVFGNHNSQCYLCDKFKLLTDRFPEDAKFFKAQTKCYYHIVPSGTSKVFLFNFNSVLNKRVYPHIRDRCSIKEIRNRYCDVDFKLIRHYVNYSPNRQFASYTKSYFGRRFQKLPDFMEDFSVDQISEWHEANQPDEDDFYENLIVPNIRPQSELEEVFEDLYGHILRKKKKRFRSLDDDFVPSMLQS